MSSVHSADVCSSIDAQKGRSVANHKMPNPEYALEGMQVIFAASDEHPSNYGSNAHSVSTSLPSSSPRSSKSSDSLEEELVVVFEFKANYMDQEAFDQAMRRHGIQEEVTHRITRVETKDREALPDAQWDDPCVKLFPVRCIYRKLVRELPEISLGVSPMPSLPSSIPTTPELPMRELAPDSSALAGRLLASQIGTQVLGTATSINPPAVASSTSPAWYTVAFCGGISVREAPDSQAPTTGVTLPCNEVFEVSDSIFGLDQRLYLKLANGSGWVFDDSLLFPDDPSVRKLQTMHDMVSLVGYCNMESGNRLGTVPQRRTSHGHCEEHAPMLPTFTHSATVSAPYTVIPFATAPPSTSGSLERNLVSTVFPLVSVPYQVQAAGGISVRVAPSLSAATTEFILNQGDVFQVCESIVGSDGRQYLRLADGRGWVPAETLPQGHDATAMQAPLPIGQVFASQASYDHRDSTTKKKESVPKAHVPYWVRLRRAKQLGLPMGPKKNTGTVGKA